MEVFVEIQVLRMLLVVPLLWEGLIGAFLLSTFIRQPVYFLCLAQPPIGSLAKVLHLAMPGPWVSGSSETGRPIARAPSPRKHFPRPGQDLTAALLATAREVQGEFEHWNIYHCRWVHIMLTLFCGGGDTKM